jgi:hypothetical protein
MGSNTAKGYPYPVGTDRLTDGDDAIHDLATAVDTKAGCAASGNVTGNIVTGGTAVSVAVTFPAGRFPATPAVVCGAVNNNAATTATAATVASGTTAAGCTISVVRAGAGSQQAWWIAHYAP